MNSQSVNRMFWNRFRKGFQGMAGMFVVALALFVSVFCYLLMPDDSPDHRAKQNGRDRIEFAGTAADS